MIGNLIVLCNLVTSSLTVGHDNVGGPLVEGTIATVWLNPSGLPQGTAAWRHNKGVRDSFSTASLVASSDRDGSFVVKAHFDSILTRWQCTGA